MKPKVVLENEVYRKIMHWVNKSQYEVSGLGTLLIEKDGTLRVTDAMLLPQKNGATHTDIEADAVCKALYELRAAQGEIKFWWHSHVQMPVFWSMTDHQAMRDFASTPGSWMLSTVFNQKREMRSAYYSPDGIESPWGKTPLFYDELDTKIETIVDEKAALWDAEYEKNVQNVVPTAGRFFDATTGEWMGNATTGVTTLDKPPYKLSKRQQKKFDRHQKQLAKEIAAEQAEEQILEEKTWSVDAFGFDAEERRVLEVLGYTDDDIEDLLDRDFTETQVILLAEAAFDYETVVLMLDDMNYTVLDVMRQARTVLDAQDRQDAKDEELLADDDMPVADRRHGLGYSQ